ncbi:hypothetical protein [Myxosarcina sp. GI1]|uniref:hypothetical protein n=1 Tax=Myxosarcina sp. GI1 TaxID=1541065 RepID=UPI00056A25E7|nr:hypothetical protein [Myxosarcina sp. GI1]
MPSLTQELFNSYSPLYKWFQTKQSRCGDRLIENHNLQMEQNQIIRPDGQIKDFALLGTAFVYAFRWHLGLLDCSFDQTVAGQYLDLTTASQLLSAKTLEERAIACLIFAAYEKQYRSGSVHEIATVLMKNCGTKLKPELHYVSVMVDDLVNLIGSISSVWDKSDSSLSKDKYYLNSVFSGSYFISADAQQIVDRTVIKCFTTLKKYPLTQQHFWQQVAYVLLDWDDEYKIEKICWYYSRQKAVFIYPINSLFKDLTELRAEFREFVEENYDEEICEIPLFEF